MLGYKSSDSDDASIKDAGTMPLGVLKASRLLRRIFFALASLFLVLALFFTAKCIAGAISLLDSPEYRIDSVIISMLSLGAFYIFAAIFYLSALIFRDISNGESPFTDKQVKRIKMVSFLLFAYAVLDSLLPKGVIVGGGPESTEPSVIRVDSGYYGINIGTFVSAVVFYFLSLVIKYGVQLQEFSDDVV